MSKDLYLVIQELSWWQSPGTVAVNIYFHFNRLWTYLSNIYLFVLQNISVYTRMLKRSQALKQASQINRW